MKKYAFFLGCMIPFRFPHMEASARKVLEILDVELLPMEGAGCCPDPVGMQSLDLKTWMSLAGRNLCIAEEMNVDILTLCHGCFETLKTANKHLKQHLEMKEEVNEVLSKVDKKFKGTIEVKHILEVMYDNLDEIKNLCTNSPFAANGIKVAVHYGCHVIRPSDIIAFDDPERPTSLDELVEATGAKSISYMRKMLCCGATIRGVSKDPALMMTREKLLQIQKVNADCIALLCPFCYVNFDIGQTEIQRLTKEKFNIPVLYYPEMIGLSLGLSPDELGLKFHRVKVAPLLKRLGIEP